MKAKGIFLLIAGLAVIWALAFYLTRSSAHSKSGGYASDALNAAFTERAIGYINRTDSLSAEDLRFQHVYIQLHPDIADTTLAAALRYPAADKDMLLTVVAGQDGALDRVKDGEFDDALRKLFRALPDKIRIYLRWDPDMEVPVQRYSWQYQSPADYIAAFRHVAEIGRSARPSLRIMWSPAGYPGADEYWPGDDVVDAIGISVNGQSELSATAFPPDPDQRTAIEAVPSMSAEPTTTPASLMPAMRGFDPSAGAGTCVVTPFVQRKPRSGLAPLKS